jgi:alpha-N-arabinofuranosidase
MTRVGFACISFLIALILAGCQQPQIQQVNQTTTPQKITVAIDAGKTGEPISKYIYGQFIEHLGRCIYGGIWAEMLEDRKFYYPITDDFNPWATTTAPFWNAGPYKYLNASPWQVIGPAGSVSMDTQNPYVGAHSPVINLRGDECITGIRQDGLAIVKGKDYTGRIILAGDSEALPISVRLVLDNGEVLNQEINSISSEFQTYPLTFTAPSSSENVKIEIISKGKGKFKIGTLSLMTADNIKGWRNDVVSLLKELNSTIYRWPGGNFVSGYNWRDGIGQRDKRPPRKNPAWKGIEHNDVGIHEYMELMELINAEPFISVNTGLGTVEEVADEVQYCNGEDSTPMGKLRAQNGHPEPFNVKWWAVGNEMYGSWQLGHMPLEEYVKKHNRVAEAMWNVDKSIKLIGVGEVGKWSETMLKVCSEHMNLISEHIYCKEKTDVIEHTKQLSQEIIRKADAHRKYREEIPELSGKDIRIAMDEWNFWYGDYIYGELGVRYHLKDALGIATGLHEYFRNSDLYFMANYAQTVNVIGCIKTTRTDASFETTGLVLKLYRNKFGILPVAVTGNTGPLDVAVAWTSDRKALTIAIVNPTEQKYKLTIDLKGTKISNTGKLWLITHSDPMAYNEPGKEPQVAIEEKLFNGFSNKLNITPLSISLYRFTIME